MKTIIGFTLLPLICLGVSILTGIVILIALRRGTQSIKTYMEEQESDAKKSGSTDTRWARADMKSDQQLSAVNEPTAVCPACGAENQIGSSTCPYCGRNLWL